MSFSMKVKDELARQVNPARHCRIAEIAAIILFCGKYRFEKEKHSYIKVYTENLTVACKYFMLLEKTFQIKAEVSVKNSHSTEYYQIVVVNRNSVELVLKAVKVLDDNGNVISSKDTISHKVIQNTCCKRAFIRGAFMAAGSVTDPAKSYHFEIVTGSECKAEEVNSLLHTFGIDSKYTLRKKNHVVYVKEGAQIVDALNVMEAHVALMNLENVRIYKEMRNSINRKVNCEAANITKTTNAAVRQQQDIVYIRDNMGFGNLTDGLKEIAQLRFEYSDASLKELGEMLHPPLGKSGVNHRLRRLSEIAGDLRRQKEENHGFKED